MDEQAIIEDYIERVGIKVFDGEVPEYEAVRDKYMEIKRIFGSVPEVVRLEWKRVYETEMKK